MLRLRPHISKDPREASRWQATTIWGRQTTRSRRCLVMWTLSITGAARSAYRLGRIRALPCSGVPLRHGDPLCHCSAPGIRGLRYQCGVRSKSKATKANGARPKQLFQTGEPALTADASAVSSQSHHMAKTCTDHHFSHYQQKDRRTTHAFNHFIQVLLLLCLCDPLLRQSGCS